MPEAIKRPPWHQRGRGLLPWPRIWGDVGDHDHSARITVSHTGVGVSVSAKEPRPAFRGVVRWTRRLERQDLLHERAEWRNGTCHFHHHGRQVWRDRD